ncbi:MAG: hypothetical protein WCJ57_04750 [Candidatus Falkowbacteria bacterium]
MTVFNKDFPGFNIQRKSSEIVITKRLVYNYPIRTIISVIILSLIAISFCMAAFSNLRNIGFYFVFLLTLFVLYYKLIDALNSTKITVSPSQIKVENYPLPFIRNFVLDRSDIENFVIDFSIIKRDVPYYLLAVLNNGKKKKILRKFSNKEEVEYILEQIKSNFF